jgi:hypothetical protein
MQPSTNPAAPPLLHLPPAAACRARPPAPRHAPTRPRRRPLQASTERLSAELRQLTDENKSLAHQLRDVKNQHAVANAMLEDLKRAQVCGRRRGAAGGLASAPCVLQLGRRCGGWRSSGVSPQDAAPPLGAALLPVLPALEPHTR